MSSSESQAATPGASSVSQQNSKGKQKSKSSATTTFSSGSTRQFTPLMQDAQARGKNPRVREGHDDDSSDSGLDWYEDDRFNAFGFDNFTRTQQRRGAAAILDDPELIMMHALARGDSIPGTRQYFTKMLCGYLDPSEIYKDPNKPSQSSGEKKQTKSKAKDRGRGQRTESPMEIE